MTALFIVVFFFFKQKTAYEMRISDWSSDVCSSDLGHVLERQSTLRPGGEGDGERWRRPNRAIEHGEIAIAGPRISALMGGSLVLPWSESIRYAVKKNGYHGGVCRQEMLVPIGIWTAGHSPETDGVAYQAAYPEAPTWWNSTDNSVATPNRAPTRRSNNMAAPADDLFSMAPIDGWLDRLMESPRSEEHTSELQSLMRISYAVFCLKQKTQRNKIADNYNT